MLLAKALVDQRKSLGLTLIIIIIVITVKIMVVICFSNML